MIRSGYRLPTPAGSSARSRHSGARAPVWFCTESDLFGRLKKGGRMKWRELGKTDRALFVCQIFGPIPGSPNQCNEGIVRVPRLGLAIAPDGLALGVVSSPVKGGVPQNRPVLALFVSQNLQIIRSQSLVLFRPSQPASFHFVKSTHRAFLEWPLLRLTHPSLCWHPTSPR